MSIHMRKTHRSARFVTQAAITLAACICALSGPLVHAQATSAESFDISRFSNAGEGWFETFYVEETYPLRDTLAAGAVHADTSVLVTETADGPLALVTDQMAYHHIAEGSVGGKDWMATF
jgi:hypothetical protein